MLKSEIQEEGVENDENVEFKTCLKEIRLLGIKNRLDRVSKDIKKAEEDKDLVRLGQLLEDFSRLSQGLLDF